MNIGIAVAAFCIVFAIAYGITMSAVNRWLAKRDAAGTLIEISRESLMDIVDDSTHAADCICDECLHVLRRRGRAVHRTDQIEAFESQQNERGQT